MGEDYARWQRQRGRPSTRPLAVCSLAALGLAMLAALLGPAPATAQGVDTRLSYRVLPSETGRVAVDSSAYGNNGVLRGGVTRVNGHYKFHALSRDHKFDRIVAPDDPSLSPGLAPFTYRVRLKVSPKAEWENHQMAVVRHGDSGYPGGNYKLELVKHRTTGVVAAICAIHDDSSGAGYIQGRGLLSTIADGHWHTIACSRVDETTVSLTVDGHTVEKTIQGDALGDVTGTAPLLVGFQFGANGVTRREQFVGKLDNITMTVQD
jgi:hypothetical protein